MKISKKQLTRIIKEEKRKLQEQSRPSQEGALLADLSMISDRIDKISDEIHGLVEPGEHERQKTWSYGRQKSAPNAGYELATQLEAQVEELNALFDRLESYFETVDALAGRNPGGSIG